MAIKLPDPGNGIPEQKTGNDEWTNMQIVRENFADQSNAASRLVGTGAGNLLEVGAYGIGSTSPQVYHRSDRLEDFEEWLKTNTLPHLARVGLSNDARVGYPTGLFIRSTQTSGFILFYSSISSFSSNKFIRTLLIQGMGTSDATATMADNLMSGQNAFADDNGFWKTSSPVVRVYANEIDPNDDARAQGVTFTRNGVGNYTLHNTLGLAQEGWQIELPQDNNRNPLVAIETEYTKDGDLNIHTYKRIFSMQTFTFTCDYDNPLDIPDGRCVDVRLHEILPEVIDEPIE